MTGNAAIVHKWTAAVYNEGDHNPLFKLCYSGKSRSRSAKKQRLWWLPDICHPAKYERSSSSHRHTATGKPQNGSTRFDNFLRSSRSYMPSTSMTTASCMTVHDAVTVALVVSKTWAFNDFPSNMCHGYRVDQSHPKPLWSNASTPLDLPSCQIWSLSNKLLLLSLIHIWRCRRRG